MSTHAHAHEEVEVGVYGLMVEFLHPEELLAATKKVVEAGYKKIDTYSPFPVHGVDEAIGAKTILPWLIFGGGLTGGLTGFGMQSFASAIHYPLNIAGKPLISWPSFMPITFELTVLFASATAVLGMLFLNGLPRPYNPLFNVPGFEQATQDRFFLCIEADDPMFDLDQTTRFLEGLEPKSLTEVPF
jgi:Alternative complex III, ActD subunit